MSTAPVSGAPDQSETSRLLLALNRQPVDSTPVWLMRQAGRYLPEYRRLREQIGNFLTLCKTPDHACELTLQPLRRFDLDAAILFSDILIIPEAMGMELAFVPGQGPVFANPLRSEKDIAALRQPDMEEDMGFVTQTIRQVCDHLHGRVPLIGFAGSPWTVAAYMISGSGGLFLPARALIHENPTCVLGLLDRLADVTTLYLKAQHAAGAQVLMIFDTWGGLLNDDNYKKFSLPYMRRIIQGLDNCCPVILYGRGSSRWLEDLADTGCSAIGLDWTVDLAHARSCVGDRVALQGNLDPAILLTSPDVIRRHVHKILSHYDGAPGHIFNLGHGVYPEVPPANVDALVQAVRSFGAERISS